MNNNNGIIDQRPTTNDQRPTTNDQPIAVHLNFRAFMNKGKNGFNAVAGGIFAYQYELTKRLAQYDDLNVDPFYFSVRHRYDVPGLNSLLRRIFFPARFTIRTKSHGIRSFVLNFLFRLIRPFISLDFLTGGSKDDVYVSFFGIPNMPIKGKLIAVIHDIVPLRLEYDPSRKEHTGGLSRDFMETFLKDNKDIIRRASKIVAVSKYTRKDFAEYFNIDESRIEVVYSNIKPFVYSREYDLNLIREKYNLPERYILYFGSCHKRKNVETLIRAYAKLHETIQSEYKLVITNPVEDTTDCVNDCGISDYVHYIEAIPEADKPAIYQMASVSVWPSLYEGFGLPVLEAMASGVPVICSNVTSMPEVAGDAAILVDPLDASGMAREIERVLTDSELRKELIAKGYENIKRFSWDESAKKFHDIIMSLQ